MGATRDLAEFAVNTTYDKLPSEVVEQGKRVILDTLGCAIATLTEDPEKAQVAGDFCRLLRGKGEATVIGKRFKAYAPMAALVNGVLSHGIDFDDTHKEALTHTSAVIVPAALAMAERENRDGKALLSSVVVGFEVAVRVGMAVMPSHYKFWHSTATNGTFGAAAAAGQNLGLGVQEMQAALGLAGTQAAGLLTYLEFGDFSKSFNPGKSALNGLFAALFAKVGATAPPPMLEDPRGYCAAYSQENKLAKLTQGLGTTYEILANAFKPYPSLLASHPAIDAILKLRSDHGLQPQRVQKITNYTYNTVKSHFSNFHPETTMAARLSVPYCMAVAALDGAAGMEQFTKERIKAQDVAEMLKKIDIVADPELNKLYPEKFPSRVVIVADGKEYEHTVYYPTGDPMNPLSTAQLKDKFRGLVSRSLDSRECERFIEVVDRLEQVKSIAELTELLPRR